MENEKWKMIFVVATHLYETHSGSDPERAHPVVARPIDAGAGACVADLAFAAP
jgi:hypothetical protein